MTKLPTYGKNKQTGNIAADILKSVLQRFAIVNSHDESIDLGIDMRGQIIENEVPQEQFFNIQCKGTDELNITSSTEYYNIQIKVSTINYWNQQNETTFLFIIDNSKLNCYWCNPLLQLGNRIDKIQKQDTVTIKVPFKNCINVQTARIPNNFINCITFYLVKKTSRLSEITQQIKNGITGNYTLDISSSFEILSILLKETNKIKEDYYEIADTIIQNIKLKLKEIYDMYNRLNYLPCTRKYCPNGLLNERGFLTKSRKSILELQEESDDLINLFEKNKDSVEILKKLQTCQEELVDLYENVLAFLFEMECEDNPLEDHSELRNMVDKIVFNHINMDDPDNSNLE
ncbi:DUF4365 domain-containing protein [Clostridium botulinum]|uniref:DUF4365 domain-containing protein n=1 Tax=Clostridium botulinum TaxID=1491 RepID=UPI0004644F2D|nr:DUF4365 domain-containing protein [Clostridium botulinum]APQ72964.1 hypothetical protein RSJ9_1287 [Clostridium botulinum]OSB15088.1 hypothetical protein B2H96_02020 [Clostridium botulinum]